MTTRSTLGVALGLALLLIPVARADTPVTMPMEVDFLLGFVGRSGCDFNSNGTWYDSAAAQAHLRSNYRYLVTIGRLSTTEDFIDRAATTSSFSGIDYAVRCDGGPILTSGQWLSDELAIFRTSISAAR